MLNFLIGIICILLHRPKKLTLAWPFKAANIKGLNFVSVLQGRFGSELKLIRVSTISMWPSEQA